MLRDEDPAQVEPHLTLVFPCDQGAQIARRGARTPCRPVCPYAVRNKDLNSLALKTQAAALSTITMTSFKTDDAVITTQSKPSFGFTPSPQDNSFSVRGTISFNNGEPVLKFLSNSGWF
jgi:hypothetical protein